MWSYTISQLKQEWEAALHGTTLDKLANPYDLIYRTARALMADIDFMEMKRTAEITNAVYGAVFDYPIPSDVKLDAVCDLTPQVNRTSADSFVLKTQKNFDKFKALHTAHVLYNSGLKSLRLAAPDTGSILFNDLNGTTSNGTWTGDNAIILNSSLQQNQIYSIPPAGGSLQFDISGAGTGYLENSTIQAIDFSVAAAQYNSWVNVAPAFLWLYIPIGATPANLTSVALRWGSSSTNYYSNSTTTNFWGQGFVNGWNLLKFEWNGAAVTGAPNAAAINYARISLTWTGAAQPGFYVDSLMFKLPTIYEITYYSSYMFQDKNGNYKSAPTDDGDVITLEDASMNIFFEKLLELSALQLQSPIPLRGKLINFDQSMYGGDYDKDKKTYQDAYKSERLKVTASYYKANRRRDGDGLATW